MDTLLSSLQRDFFDPRTFVGALAWGGVFLAAALTVATVIRRAARRLESRLTDQTGMLFVTALAQVVVYLVAFVLYAHLVPELRSLGTALLAGASVVSLVAGLAAQSTLGNLVAGLSLVLYRPVRVGDRVRLAAPGGVVTATVERISLGFTVLRGEGGDEVVVPNGVMMGTVIVRTRREGAG